MAKIFSYEPFGMEGFLVNIESDIRKGLEGFDIVGISDGVVKELKSRIKTILGNDFPNDRVLISLSPADLKKDPTLHDLGIELSVSNNREEGTPILILGELNLDGTIRPVRAITAALMTAKDAGIKYAIIPKSNYEEAREIEMKVI